MFTLQASQMYSQLLDAGATPELADVLSNIIGNCSQALTHRGPVTLAGPDPENSDVSTTTEGYALTINEGSTEYVQEGANLNVAGTLNILSTGIINNVNVVNALNNLPIGAGVFWFGAIIDIPANWTIVGTTGMYLRINTAAASGTGGSLNTGSQTTGLTVSDHANHHHTVNPGEKVLANALGTVNGWADSQLPADTSNETSTLSHTVNESGHVHTIAPTWFDVVLIKRVS